MGDVYTGFELGMAQGNSLVAPVAAVIAACDGLWFLAVIFTAATVIGLLLWHRLGWQLGPKTETGKDNNDE